MRLPTGTRRICKIPMATVCHRTEKRPKTQNNAGGRQRRSGRRGSGQAASPAPRAGSTNCGASEHPPLKKKGVRASRHAVIGASRGRASFAGATLARGQKGKRRYGKNRRFFLSQKKEKTRDGAEIATAKPTTLL